MHVLLVSPLDVNHPRRWADHALANGCKVTIAGDVRPGRTLADLRDVAEQVEVAPEGLRELGTARQVAWLRDLLRRCEPDLVHAHWLPRWGYFAALSGTRPLIVTPWGSDIYLATGTKRRRANHAMACADAVLARSPHMKRVILARGVPAGRVYEVDLGVDLERFRPAPPQEAERLRRELELPAGPIILSTRAGTSLYNLDVLIHAYRALRELLPQANMVIVHTDAPLARSVRTALHGLDGPGVRVVGSVPHAHISKYLKIATVGVSIPSSDGSPSSVWEALAAGVPMVLSNLRQIGERVGKSGAVRLVETQPEAVASALHEIIADPELRDGMSHAGRAWAEANVDQRDQMGRLGEVYAAMAKQSPSPARPAGPPASEARRSGGRDRATAASASPGPS